MRKSGSGAVSLGVLTVAVACMLCRGAKAQDVPGIEICTAEKTMERRTGCLQSNVNFLQQNLNKLARESQRKLDAASVQIEALKRMIADLQKEVSDLRAAQKKPVAPAAKPAPAKDGTK